MITTGIVITDLTNIGSDLNAVDVLPIVNIDVDETQKVTMQNLGNFILGNIANTSNLTVANLTVSNHTILNTANVNVANIAGNTTIGGSANIVGNVSVGNISVPTGNITAGNVLTNHLLYANGNPWNLTNSAGNTGEVQYSNGNGNFAASNVFKWNTSSNTLSVQNLNLVYANTNVKPGTSEQVLGIIDQGAQTIGWKTLPTNYMNVYLRDGNVYISSITPVLRTIPIKVRDPLIGYLEVPAA